MFSWLPFKKWKCAGNAFFNSITPCIVEIPSRISCSMLCPTESPSSHSLYALSHLSYALLSAWTPSPTQMTMTRFSLSASSTVGDSIWLPSKLIRNSARAWRSGTIITGRLEKSCPVKSRRPPGFLSCATGRYAVLSLSSTVNALSMSALKSSWAGSSCASR